MKLRRRSEREFADEIQAHLDLEIDRLRSEGIPEDEARHLAQRAFGNVTAARERFYESRRNLFFDTLLRDTQYALRTLARSPGYAAAAILTLALGIGANTAIFSTIDEVLFRPPDLPHPERLAQIYSLNRKTSTYVSSSWPDYMDFRREARSFQQLAAYVRFPLNVQLNRSAPERTSVEAVSDNYFAMLEVSPLAGRAIAPGDDVPHAPPVAMIAEELWRTRLGADRGVVGRTLTISGREFTIIGIVPGRVHGLNLNWVTPPRIWIPLHASAFVLPRLDRFFDARAIIWLVLTGRLNPGVTIASAQAEMQTIAAHIADGRDLTAVVFPLSRAKFWPSYRKGIGTSLAGFGIASGLILLLACANVSNLLLGRAFARRREIAVRLAVGGGRGRIVRQLLTESALLAVFSCGGGLAISSVFMQLLRRFPDALGLTLALDLSIERRALAFCIALSALTVALFGLAPALQSTRLEILPSLKESGNTGGGRHDWFRSGLIAVQAAFAMILLVGGGLYGRSLWNAYRMKLGFRSDHLLTAAFSLPPPGADSADRMWNMQQTLLQRLSTTPGVVSATLSSTGILNAGLVRLAIEAPSASQSSLSVVCEFAARDFFRTMGIPLLGGRDFAARDEGAGKIAIVNHALARRLFRGVNALGKTIVVNAQGGKSTPYVIAGVAADARYASLWEDPAPRLYLPASRTDGFAGFLAVRTSAPPVDLADPLRRLSEHLTPLAPLYEIQTAGERVTLFLTPQRVAAGILGGFAILALVLTAIGLYSVVAFSVARQRRELGIRIAIGAQPREIFSAVLRRSITPVVIGIGAGVAASIPLMRILATKATDVSPYDRTIYAAVALILVAVALIAAIIPARRAMQVDPSAALRSE